ncbi:MAG: hypothetical protein JSS99_14765 [Actinobacteria bacterium]|nr:hypothetical protein [Actinomycetota bacterium]
MLTALAAAVVMASAVGTATAGRWSTSEQRFRINWASLEISGFATNVRCAVTVEGSYHYRTFLKTTGALLGTITGVTARHPCTGGELWFFNGTENLEGTTLANSLPWVEAYESFTGTLPRRVGFLRKLWRGLKKLLKATFLGITIRCTYTTSVTEPAHAATRIEEATGAMTTVELEGTIRSETGGCPSVTLLGSGPITTPSGARITLTLI